MKLKKTKKLPYLRYCNHIFGTVLHKKREHPILLIGERIGTNRQEVKALLPLPVLLMCQHFPIEPYVRLRAVPCIGQTVGAVSMGEWRLVPLCRGPLHWVDRH